MRADVQAEQLCGRESLLGEYFDAGGDGNRPLNRQAVLREDEDEEML